MMAAPWSTAMLAVMSLVYGSEIIRLVPLGIVISSGLIASRIQALGLAAATAENDALKVPMTRRCSSRLHPLAARMAFSNSG